VDGKEYAFGIKIMKKKRSVIKRFAQHSEENFGEGKKD